MLVGFKSEKLKPLTGKTLAEVAKMRGKDPIDTAMDLIAEDESRISTVYYLMSEENVKKELRKPWISFGSDEASQAPESPFTKSNPHPRAYGNFARVLGKYVRDEKVLSMSDAIHRLSGLPATNLGLDHRGFLKEGMFADVVVFDPATIADHATFEKPHQYADRCETCVRERCAGHQKRRAHRRQTRSRLVGTGENQVTLCAQRRPHASHVKHYASPRKRHANGDICGVSLEAELPWECGTCRRFKARTCRALKAGAKASTSAPSAYCGRRFVRLSRACGLKIASRGRKLISMDPIRNIKLRWLHGALHDVSYELSRSQFSRFAHAWRAGDQRVPLRQHAFESASIWRELIARVIDLTVEPRRVVIRGTRELPEPTDDEGCALAIAGNGD